MIDPALIEEIRKDPFLNYMIKPVERFEKYLVSTNEIKLKLRGLVHGQHDSEGGSQDPLAVEFKMPYIHRWTREYDRYIVWKLFNLQGYYQKYPAKMPKYTIMITLTGSHASPRAPSKRGLNHMAYLKKFQEAHRKEKKMVEKYLGTVDYLSMLEPHPKSGYVHAHDLYFLNDRPTDETLAKIKNHWVKTLGMGSDKRAFDVEIKEPKSFAEIQSLIAYPLAYLGKSTIGAVGEWTKYDVVFNTCLWLSAKHQLYGGINKRVRVFQPSRSLTAIMKHEYSPDNSPIVVPPDNYQHIETTMMKPGEEIQIYKCDNYEEMMPVWRLMGGDDGQFDTLETLREMNEPAKGFG